MLATAARPLRSLGPRRSVKQEAESPGHAVCGAGSAARTMGFAVKVLVEVEPAFWELGPGERESLRKLPIASSSCWIGIRRELDLNQKNETVAAVKGRWVVTVEIIGFVHVS